MHSFCRLSGNIWLTISGSLLVQKDAWSNPAGLFCFPGWVSGHLACKFGLSCCLPDSSARWLEAAPSSGSSYWIHAAPLWSCALHRQATAAAVQSSPAGARLQMCQCWHFTTRRGSLPQLQRSQSAASGAPWNLTMCAPGPAWQCEGKQEAEKAERSARGGQVAREEGEMPFIILNKRLAQRGPASPSCLAADALCQGTTQQRVVERDLLLVRWEMGWHVCKGEISSLWKYGRREGNCLQKLYPPGPHPLLAMEAFAHIHPGFALPPSAFCGFWILTASSLGQRLSYFPCS